MKKRSCFSLLIMMTLFFATTTQNVGAAESVPSDETKAERSNPLHVISSTELHQSIQNFQKQAFESRKSVQDFLNRPEVIAEIQKMGGSPENYKAQAALLSDNELINLNRQMMSWEIQEETAGGAGRTLIGLIFLALSIYWLVQKYS
jgi:hypothetical protein